MPSLNNVATGDAYSAATTLRFDAKEQITVAINNASIYLQFALEAPRGLRADSYPFTNEEKFALPSSQIWSIRDFGGFRIVGVRARSAVAGTPARLTVHA